MKSNLVLYFSFLIVYVLKNPPPKKVGNLIKEMKTGESISFIFPFPANVAEILWQKWPIGMFN